MRPRRAAKGKGKNSRRGRPARNMERPNPPSPEFDTPDFVLPASSHRPPQQPGTQMHDDHYRTRLHALLYQDKHCVLRRRVVPNSYSGILPDNVEQIASRIQALCQQSQVYVKATRLLNERLREEGLPDIVTLEPEPEGPSGQPQEQPVAEENRQEQESGPAANSNDDDGSAGGPSGRSLLSPDPEDLLEEHYFDCSPQPAVGFRLKHILAFLRDQDPDHDPDWANHVAEIEAYLAFLEKRSSRQNGRRGWNDSLSRQRRPQQSLVEEVLAELDPPPVIRGQHTRLMLQEAHRLLETHRVYGEISHGRLDQAYILPNRNAVPRITVNRLLSPLAPGATAQFQQQIQQQLMQQPVTDPVDQQQSLEPLGAPSFHHSRTAPTDARPMAEHYPDADRHRRQLADDDRQLLAETVQPGEQPFVGSRLHPRTGPNLADLENREFYQGLATQTGWVRLEREPGEGGQQESRPPPAGSGRVRRLLPDGTVLGQDAESFARERGARRAGLQQVLRQLGAAGLASRAPVLGEGQPQSVVLPLPASVVAQQVEMSGEWATQAGQENATGGEEAEAAEENGSRLQTHPYTVQMRRYRQSRREWMDQARSKVERDNRDNPDWVTLPKFHDAVCFGRAPFGSTGPRRPLPPAMEHDRKLLVLLREVSWLMIRANEIAPRPLLKHVLKYVQRGLKGARQPGKSVRLRGQYDFTDVDEDALEDDENDDAGGGDDNKSSTRRVKRLNETEARWLKFLLLGSTNEQLAKPLPSAPDLQDIQEANNANPSRPALCVSASDIAAIKEAEGSRALYHCFTQRLQALMDDRSDLRLFQDVNTAVGIDTLVDALNWSAGGPPEEMDVCPRHYTSVGGGVNAAAEAGYPQQKTRFTVYDVRFFCHRLSQAGRCRYDPRAGDRRINGEVMRPILTLHPEHRIGDDDGAKSASWIVRARENLAEHSNIDDAIGAPRRDEEVDQTWEATVESGRPGRQLRGEVHDFFCCLAFRLGRTLRQLEDRDRLAWTTALQDPEMALSQGFKLRHAMRTWQHEYDKIRKMVAKDKGPNSLAGVVQLADPGRYRRGLTEAAAQKLIRHNLIAESERAWMCPERTNKQNEKNEKNEKSYLANNSPLWDWANPQIVGRAPQFFNMNRWPLQLQTPETAQRIRDQVTVDGAFDPEMLWDPTSEDPTPPTHFWIRPPAYGFQRVKHYPGPARYVLGETRLQRQVVIQDLTDRVADAMGVGEERPSFLKRLASNVPFFGFGRDDEDDFGGKPVKMPKVNMSILGNSEELHRQMEEDRDRAEGGDDRMDVDWD